MSIPSKLYAEEVIPVFTGESNQDLVDYLLDVLDLARRLTDDRAELRLIVEQVNGRK